MLPVFAASCASKIAELTTEMYRKEFSSKKKASSRVWCLLGYKPYVKQLQLYETAIEQAKIITNGSIAFAKVNCQAETSLCQQLSLNHFPSIVFKNRTSSQDYQESPNPARIAKIAFSLVNSSLIEEVDDFWIEDYREKPTAILFTRKRDIPGYWAAISRVYAKTIRIGICRDDSFFEEFGIKQSPVVVFYDESRTVYHEGRLKFRYINESANAFIHKRLSKSPIGADFHVNTEMPEVCYDYTKTCVFSNEEFIDPQLDELRSRFRASKQFRFFVGKDDFPFKGIPNGATVVYNAKKDGIIVEEDPHQVSSLLDRVIDGTAKYKSIGKLKYSGEL